MSVPVTWIIDCVEKGNKYMISELLNYTWKSTSGYSYAYPLISNKSKKEDIIKDGRTKVLWGGTKPDTFAARCALEKAGISNLLETSFWQKSNVHTSYYDAVDYKYILKNADKYYHIIDCSDAFDGKEAFKLLQYAGIDDFSIVFSGYTKDFSERVKLQNAFFEAINEIFSSTQFLGHWNDGLDCKLYSLNGAGYWDILYMLIYNMYKRKSDVKYLEVGPGYGIMSCSLKKLLSLDITWLIIPAKDDMRDYNKKALSRQLCTKYNIHTVEGYLETDDFAGCYDIIVMSQVMEHLVCNPVGSFKKLKYLLADDGRIFISVPEETRWPQVESYKEIPYANAISEDEYMRRNIINEYAHFHEYTYEEAIAVFEESGLECVEHVWSMPIHHFVLKKAK